MTAGVKPITDDERHARMEKARRLMVENKIDAIYLEPGTSMFYYAGVQWGRSERMRHDPSGQRRASLRGARF